MWSLPRVKALVAVYEEGSFTRAAEREATTQSGLSQHIRQLEDALGAALFERGAKSVKPTRAGDRAYAHCVDALRALDAARRATLSDAPPAPVRAGLMPAFTRSVLAPALERFVAREPRAEIRVTEAYSGVLTDLVRSGRLDFAIVPAFEGGAGLRIRFVARDREMLVARKGALPPAAEDGAAARLADLGPLKLLLPGAQNVRRRNLDIYCATHGATVAARMELDSMMGTLAYVARSDWATVLPSLVLAEEIATGALDIRPIDAPPLYAEFVTVEPARQAMPESATLFEALLREEAARLVSS